LTIARPAEPAYPTVCFIVLESYRAAAGIDHPNHVVLVDGRDPFPIRRYGKGTDNGLCVCCELFCRGTAIRTYAPDLVFPAFIAEYGEVPFINELRSLVPDAAPTIDLHPAIAFRRGDEQSAATDQKSIVTIRQY